MAGHGGNRVVRYLGIGHDGGSRDLIRQVAEPVPRINATRGLTPPKLETARVASAASLGRRAGPGHGPPMLTAGGQLRIHLGRGDAGVAKELPNSSSARPSSIWRVAKEWRSVWGVTVNSRPDSRTSDFMISQKPCRVSR